ncbi:hypothetical protein Q8A73_000244 [Channa argus]|nr:hypothetical protein Q8A73_000244 [Channa argus]
MSPHPLDSKSSLFVGVSAFDGVHLVSLLVPLVPVLVVVVVVVVLVVVGLLLCKKKTNDSDGLNMRGISDQTNMEFSNYENCPPASTGQDSTYQSLNPLHALVSQYEYEGAPI